MQLMGRTIQTPVCWRLQPSAVRFSLDIAMTVPNWRYPWTSFWNWLHSWWYPGTDYIWVSSWYSQAMVQKCRALSEFRRIYWENVTVSRENCPAKCLFKHIAGQFLKLKCFANIFIEFHCDLLNESGIPAEKVKKLYEGRPNILDMITNGKIDLVVNSP